MRNWEWRGSQRPWLVVRYYPSTFLNGLSKTTKSLNEFDGSYYRPGASKRMFTLLQYTKLPSWKKQQVLTFAEQRYRDSSVCMATGYDLNGSGSIPGSARFLFSPQRPDQLWGQPSLLSNGYRRLFPRVWSGRGVKLATHLHLVPRSRKLELYLHSPLCPHSIVLNYLSIGTILPYLYSIQDLLMMNILHVRYEYNIH
jgi:hypothetical protein